MKDSKSVIPAEVKYYPDSAVFVAIVAGVVIVTDTDDTSSPFTGPCSELMSLAAG